MSDSRIDKLRREGAQIASGALAVDRERAREMLRKFQLPDPHLYVVQLVRCASLAGASRIMFKIDVDEVQCDFDAPLDPDGLADLWERGVGDRLDPLNALALAVGAATAVNPRKIAIKTTRARRRARFVLAEGEETFEVEDHRGFTETTNIRVREKFRFGHILEYFYRAPSELVEVELLRQHCRWSSMYVVVNDDVVSRNQTWRDDEAAFRLEKTTESGARLVGETALRPGEPMLTCHLLRDGVEIGTMSYPATVGGVGYVEANDLTTDLTMLTAVRDEAFHTASALAGLGSYFRALEEWLVDQPHDLARRVLIEALGRRAHPTMAVSPELESLIETLMARKMWLRACGGDRGTSVSVSEALKQTPGGPIVYWVNGDFDVEIEGLSPVLGAPEVFHNSQLDRLFSALQDARGVSPREVTARFRAADQQLANRRRWEARPRTEPPRSEHSITVSRSDRTLTATLGSQIEGRTAFNIDGRLLRADSTDKGLVDLWFDGSFQPDVTWESYHPSENETLVELLEALTEELPELVSKAANAWSKAGRDVPEELVTRWVAALLNDSASSRIFAQAGVTRPSRADAPRPRHSFAPVADTVSSDAWVETVGPLTDVPFVWNLSKQLLTLRQIAAMETIGWYMRTSSWSAEFKAAEAILRRSPDQILLVDGDSLELLTRLFSDRLVDLRAERRRRQAAVSFRRKPEFSLPALNVLAEKRFEFDEGIVDGRLVANELAVDTLVFLHEGRELVRKTVPSDSGAFFFVIESEELKPVEDFTDFVASETYTDLIDACCGPLRDDLFADWIRTAKRHPQGRGATLAYFTALRNLYEESDDHWTTPLIPVFRRDQPGHEAMASHVELAEIARSGPVYFSRGAPPEEPAAGPSVTVNFGPRGVARDIFRELLPCDLADVSALSEDAREAYTRAFRRQPHVPFDIPGAAMIQDVGDESLSLLTGLFLKPPAGRPRKIRVEATHEGRLLEVVNVASELGYFEALARGSLIEPDATYSALLTGREAIRQRAVAASEDVVAKACELAETGEYDSTLRGFVLELLARWNETPIEEHFDLGVTLRNSRLFRLASGRRVSYVDVSRLATDGIVPFVLVGGRDDALLIPGPEMELHQRALAEWKLRIVQSSPAAADNDVLEVQPPSPAMDMELELEPPAPVAREPDTAPIFARLHRLLAPSVGMELHLSWDDALQDLCTVEVDQVRLSPDHPLVIRAVSDPTFSVDWYLASLLLTAINAELREFNDVDERAAQRGLLRARREDLRVTDNPFTAPK